MYSLHSYGSMTADPARMGAYVEALKANVRPGDRVLDLGAGTGIFSLLAVRLGAEKVIAIEPNKAACRMGEQLARLNGCGDRIEWFPCRCQEVDLIGQVDLIVADLRGILPYLGDNLASIADVRDRFLRPGGTLLPQRDRLSVALASSTDAWRRQVTPWLDNDLGFDLSPMSERLYESWTAASFTPGETLSDHVLWHEIDYNTVHSPDTRNTVVLEASRDGEAHGFWLWFDAEIAPGIGFSSAPGAEAPEVYGRAFFPWPSPVTMRAGDRARIEIAVHKVQGEQLWRWRTRFDASDSSSPMPGPWDQTTFQGAVPDPAELRKRGDRYQPSPNADGRILKRLLELMDGDRSNEAISRILCEESPERFPTDADAFDFVCDQSAKFSA